MTTLMPSPAPGSVTVLPAPKPGTRNDTSVPLPRVAATPEAEFGEQATLLGWPAPRGRISFVSTMRPVLLIVRRRTLPLPLAVISTELLAQVSMELRSVSGE